MITRKNSERYPFSFTIGLFRLLGLKERRLEIARKIILSRSESDALLNDWKRVGDDMRFAMKKVEKEQKLEPYACE